MAKIIRLTENQFGEMMAYHGSGADFDKFNHKKYLSKGAGSQYFGWGTYVTDDKYIANGYSDAAKEIKGKNGEYTIKKTLMAVYGLSKEDAEDEAFQLYYNYVMPHGIFMSKRLFEKALDKKFNFGEKKIAQIKRWINLLDEIEKTDSYLYEVDIPEDNGFNYLWWNNSLTEEQSDAISNKLLEFEKKYNGIDLENVNEDYFEVPDCGASWYDFLEKVFENFGTKDGPKAASLFLMQCGFDGIKYPAGTKWRKPDGAAEDAMNYVIFDANKVKIINKTEV